MYKTEELSYAIDKVGIKALLAPPSFRRSNYYKTLVDIIPEMLTHSEGKSNLSSDSFPKLKHVIIFDSVVDGKSYRWVLFLAKNQKSNNKHLIDVCLNLQPSFFITILISLFKSKKSSDY